MFGFGFFLFDKALYKLKKNMQRADTHIQIKWYINKQKDRYAPPNLEYYGIATPANGEITVMLYSLSLIYNIYIALTCQWSLMSYSGMETRV